MADNIETQLSNIINIYNNRDIYYSNIDLNSAQISEDNITKFIFSNYIDEKIRDNNNNRYVEYIIGDNDLEFDNDAIYVETKYYGNDFDRINNNENTVSSKIFYNKNMQDFDISYYASEDVKKYLFLFDTLSELYKNTGRNINNMIDNKIQIKTRYYYDENSRIQLYKIDEYRIFPLKIIKRESGELDFNTPDGNDDLFSIIENDIRKHLNFLNQSDITEGSQEYIDNIVYFYKYCKLLLEYLIIHSLKISNNVIDDAYIKVSINNVFYNLFEHIKNNDSNTDNMAYLYNSKVLNAKKKLSKINNENERNTEHINDNRKKILMHQDKTKYISNIYLFTIMIFSVLFIIYFLILVINFDKNIIKLAILFLTIISIILVIFIYKSINYDTVEFFYATIDENIDYIELYRQLIIRTNINIEQFIASLENIKVNFENSSNILINQIDNVIIPENRTYLDKLNDMESNIIIYNTKYDTMKLKLENTIDHYNTYKSLISVNSNIIFEYKNIENTCNYEIQELQNDIDELSSMIITQDMIDELSQTSNFLNNSNNGLISNNIDYLYKIEHASSNRLEIFNNALIENNSKIYAITNELENARNDYDMILYNYSYSNALLERQTDRLEFSNIELDSLQDSCNLVINQIKDLNLLFNEQYNIDKNSALHEIKTTIELEILYNILDNVPFINYNIISNTLNRDLIYYESYNKTLDNYKKKSDKDIKISKLNNLIEKEKILLVLFLILIMAIILFIYFYIYESLFMFILMLILIILATINYFYNIKIIVRTNYKNYYWSNPDKRIKLLL